MTTTFCSSTLKRASFEDPIVAPDGSKRNESKAKNCEDLIAAIWREDQARVTSLMENHDDLTTTNVSGFTPLLQAALTQNIKIFKILVANSTSDDLNATDVSGKTALMHILDPKMVEILLKNGADIEVKDKKGNTALMLAVKDRNLDLVKILLKNGANIHAETKIGKTPLLQAGFVQNIKIFETLVANCTSDDLNVTDFSGKTALMYVQDPKMVEILLKNGADIEIKDKEGNTALMLAVKYRNLDLVKIFLKNGANIHAETKKGNTPFKEAIKILDKNVSFYNLFVPDSEKINIPQSDLKLILNGGNNVDESVAKKASKLIKKLLLKIPQEAKKRKALIFFPIEDHNLAFNWKRKFHQIKQISKYCDITIKFPTNKDKLIKNLSSKSHQYDLVWIAGHGSRYGTKFTKNFSLDIKLMKEILKNAIYFNALTLHATIVINSCSTGIINGLADFIAIAAPRRHIYCATDKCYKAKLQFEKDMFSAIFYSSEVEKTKHITRYIRYLDYDFANIDFFPLDDGSSSIFKIIF